MTDDKEQRSTDPEQPTIDYLWLVNCVLIGAVGAFLRFWELGIKPLHHDEGVNGHFLTTLFRDGVYKYDPANYHGPTLYYITLAFTKAFGLETLPVRWSVAIFGVLMVVLAFFLKRYIGKIGSLSAALFIALSPGLVYISRYFIHEIFFVFLSLGVVVAIAFFIEKRKPGVFAIFWTALLLLVSFFPSTLNLASAVAGENSRMYWAFAIGFFVIEAALIFFVVKMLLNWNDGRPVYLLLASACVALMFATKETAFITLGTMLIACLSVWILRRINPARKDDPIADPYSSTALTWPNFRAALGSGTDLILIVVAAGVVFIYVSVLFFSSFFTYPEGVQKAFEAYAIWTKTGSKDHTQNGFWAYLKWGMEIEAPIFILAAIGTAIAFIKARHRFAMFTGLWAFGLFAAYSIIPYKTPWLAISFLMPMCIIGGYAINELAVMKNIAGKIAAGVLAISASAVLGYQTYDMNFVRYDNEEMPYVYAHTKREFLDMVREIERYAEKSGKGKDAAIQVVSPDYWPMVWYLKDYPKAVFHGKLAGADGAEMIVAKKDDQDVEVIRRYSANYKYIGSYGLRPGVDLVLLVRKDLVGDEGKELYKISAPY